MKAKRMQKGTFLHFLTKKVTFFIFFFAVIFFMHIFAAKIRVRRLQTKRKVFSSAENSKLHNSINYEKTLIYHCHARRELVNVDGAKQNRNR